MLKGLGSESFIESSSLLNGGISLRSSPWELRQGLSGSLPTGPSLSSPLFPGHVRDGMAGGSHHYPRAGVSTSPGPHLPVLRSAHVRHNTVVRIASERVVIAGRRTLWQGGTA